MSDYKYEKVVRLKVDKKDLASALNLELDEVYYLDCNKDFSDLFDYGKVCKFQIAPTEEFFIDYVLESRIDCGEYGRSRKLSANEFKRYQKIFSKVIPIDLLNKDNFRVVEYCWYNATECASYFEKEDDDFYNEV